MFGYVRYSKLDLTYREHNRYKAYYCGFCRQIKQNFGEITRLTVNYDLVFLAILLSGIYGATDNSEELLCFLKPLKKKKIIRNAYIDYASFINVLLVYYKCMDDYADNNSLIARLGAVVLYKNFAKARAKYPDKEKILREGLQKIQQLESSEKACLDDLSEIFGSIFGELYVYSNHDENAAILRRIGYLIGKFIYILDCYDDLPQDIKKKRFNPLIGIDPLMVFDKIEQEVYNISNELEKIISDSDIKHSGGLISNIVKLGLRNKARSVLQKRRCSY
jgi:hypothetical protein